MSWLRTSEWGVSRHRNSVSRVIGMAPAARPVEAAMSKRRLVITAVLAGASQSEVARTYGVSQGWISRLMARYRAEGEAAFEPRSRRPEDHPGRHRAGDGRAGPAAAQGARPSQGLDAGADTIGWHLTHHHQITVSRATINRILVRGRRGHPGPVEATEVLLHPVRGRAAQRDLAVRLHPLPAHPPRRQPRRRHRDHHLARRPLPLRPAHLRPRPGHRPDRARHLPQTAGQHGYPGIHADRQRHGLHRPVRRRRRRRPQRPRARATPASTSCRRTPGPTTPPPAARSNGSSRP